jgi:hypothetical protein
MKIVIRRAIISLCLFISSVLTFAQNPTEILNHYLDTVSLGDRSKWAKIKSMYATSTTYFNNSVYTSQVDFRNSNPPSYAKTYKVWPDYDKEELYNDSSYTGVPSKFYYLKDKDVIVLNNGMPKQETRHDEKRRFEFTPTRILTYMKESKKVLFRGLKKIPGEDLEFFEILITTRSEEHYFLFDTSTYLLKAEFFPETNIHWLYSDYRDINGYLIPGTISGLKDGMLFSMQSFTSFSFNMPLANEIFVPPTN